jgi:hypothetical protein
MKSMTTMVTAIGILVALAGCGTAGAEDVTGVAELDGVADDGLADESVAAEGVAEGTAIERTPIEGSYQVTTTFDLTASSVAPDPAYDALTTLTELRDDPAALIFDLLDAAGVPLVGDLRDALPGYLEDQLEDWIDAALAASGMADELDLVIAQSQTVLTQADMISIIDLPAPDEDGHMVAEHTITALRWAPPVGGELSISLEGAGIDRSVEAWAEPARYGGQVAFGKHDFALPYGEYAWGAINKAMIDRTGKDLRGQLAAIADCPAIAAGIADNCVFGVCVGHESELTAICELGLDAAVEQAHEQIASYQFTAVALQSGACAVTSRGMHKGAWNARIDAGMGAREHPPLASYGSVTPIVPAAALVSTNSSISSGTGFAAPSPAVSGSTWVAPGKVITRKATSWSRVAPSLGRPAPRGARRARSGSNSAAATIPAPAEMARTGASMSAPSKARRPYPSCHDPSTCAPPTAARSMVSRAGKYHSAKLVLPSVNAWATLARGVSSGGSSSSASTHV